MHLKRGVPLRGTFSPFFGALYLKPLDDAFGAMDVFYRPCIDDCIVLVKSKHQFAKAKKRLFKLLRGLKLEVSSQKTWLGKLDVFHFLGALFLVPKNVETDEIHVKVEMHPR